MIKTLRIPEFGYIRKLGNGKRETYGREEGRCENKKG
jgi:hypothetical protein